MTATPPSGDRRQGEVEPSRATLLVGGLLAFITVSIWAIWIVGTRQAVTHDIPLAWIGLLRFAVPALLLAPYWWRAGLLPKGLDRRLLALMVIGSGAPFFAVTAFGMNFANAAQIGVLLPGTMPLFVAVLSAAIHGERFGRWRLIGFTVTTVALVLIGGPALLAGQGIGLLLIPFGALLWAVYTLAFRQSGLTARAAAGVVAAWSTLMLLPFAAFTSPLPLLNAPINILAWQIASQSVLSGVIAGVCFGAAVRLVGSSRASIFSALAPALAALIAIPVLGEVPSLTTTIGIGLAVAGVALASGFFDRRPGGKS
ncbi:MAG: DMT family transporter [Hyphomicrobiales bacterium]|nr:DMT family transporter [Hyphomicrobiales bacterium]